MATDFGGGIQSQQQWLFDSKQLLSSSGAGFVVRYVGFIPVRVSMRSLEFEQRRELSRFCITTVAEIAGLRVSARRSQDERYRMLLDMVSHEDARVFLVDAHLVINIVTLQLILSGAESEMEARAGVAPLARYRQLTHDLSCVSFAAGGEGDTLDFVAYVVNDPTVGRLCHVLECSGGQANQVVITIGQAFHLRGSTSALARGNLPNGTSFHGGFNVPSNLQSSVERISSTNASWNSSSNTSLNTSFNGQSNNPFAALRTMAGQNRSLSQSSTAGAANAFGRPPLTPGSDVASVASADDDAWRSMPPIPQLPPPMSSLQTSLFAGANSSAQLHPQSRTAAITEQESFIKFDSESQPAALVNASFGNEIMNASSASLSSSTMPSARQHKSNDLATLPERPTPTSADRNEPPGMCAWYHGVLSRGEAEQLLRTDGDFLVRASTSSAGQYVLSGRYAGQPKHLLLVDPNGRVRTSDREFESVQHLVEYHVENRVPIVSHDSQLFLANPVYRAPRLGND